MRDMRSAVEQAAHVALRWGVVRERGNIVYEDVLASMALFRDLPRRELAWLGEACREREYAAGEALMRQGSGGVGLIFILDGRARISVRDLDGVERVLGVVEAGAALGEAVALDDGASPVTVTALVPVRALVLPVWDFHTTLREYPEIGIHLLAIIGRRLRAEAASAPGASADAGQEDQPHNPL